MGIVGITPGNWTKGRTTIMVVTSIKEAEIGEHGMLLEEREKTLISTCQGIKLQDFEVIIGRIIGMEESKGESLEGREKTPIGTCQGIKPRDFTVITGRIIADGEIQGGGRQRTNFAYDQPTVNPAQWNSVNYCGWAN
ncbi:hypothetical protein V6N11_049065 [Hibiscus sabdariffa]|uniref:Uncharacterized protein n=1 Tax=Hibiscus sabdariffa TaxID=183260 RepID=A0ABR2PX37_9ROSI